jgi:hypothetical protein
VVMVVRERGQGWVPFHGLSVTTLQRDRSRRSCGSARERDGGRRMR